MHSLNALLSWDSSSNLLPLSTGGSETFQDKVNFFQRELRHIHSKRPRTKTCLKITRHSILDSVSAPLLHCNAPYVSQVIIWTIIYLSLIPSPWRLQGTSLCQTGVRTSRLCFRMRKVKKTSDLEKVTSLFVALKTCGTSNNTHCKKWG